MESVALREDGWMGRTLAMRAYGPQCLHAMRHSGLIAQTLGRRKTMKIARLRGGFTLLEILIVIAIVAILGVLAMQALDRMIKDSVTATNAVTTIVMQIDQTIDLDPAGNSSTTGSILVLINAPPPAAGQSAGTPTAGTRRNVTLTVFQHHPNGTVSISPTQFATDMVGSVNFTLSTTQYEGGVTIIGIDSTTGEGSAITVSVGGNP